MVLSLTPFPDFQVLFYAIGYCVDFMLVMKASRFRAWLLLSTDLDEHHGRPG